MGKIYTTDVGTQIRTTVESPIAGYSTAKYKVQYSDNSTDDLTCLVEDETEGIIYYIKTAADFDVAGDAKVQAEITFPTQVFLGAMFIVPLFNPFT